VWPEYTVEWTIGGSRYRITVLNPDHRSGGIASAQLDGVAVDPRAIPLANDGEQHDVTIVLGAGASAPRPLTAAGVASQ
jgi:cellobiose phosphorylase